MFAIIVRPKGAVTCQPRATPWGSEHNNVEALKGRNSQVIESPSSLSLMNGTFGIDCLLRPFRAFWSCASRTQGDALVVLHKSLAIVVRPERAATCQPRATPWGPEHHKVGALKGRDSPGLDIPHVFSM